MMGFDDAAQAMQAMGSALGAQELRASLQQLSQRPMNHSSMDMRMVSIDDLNHPCIHPSRVGDPPAQGCEAAPNRKPKPWESVRWQPRTKR